MNFYVLFLRPRRSIFRRRLACRITNVFLTPSLCHSRRQDIYSHRKRIITQKRRSISTVGLSMCVEILSTAVQLYERTDTNGGATDAPQTPSRLGRGIYPLDIFLLSTPKVSRFRHLRYRRSVPATALFIARRYASAMYAVVVCRSVTLRYCIKTAKRRITQVTPHYSPGTLHRVSKKTTMM